VFGHPYSFLLHLKTRFCTIPRHIKPSRRNRAPADQTYPEDPSLQRHRISSGSPYEPRIGISRVVRSGRVISVCGTAPLDPDGKTVGVGNATKQTPRCLEIIQAAIEGPGGHLSDVIRTRVFLKRIEDWEKVALVHGEFFKDIRPASTLVQVVRFIDPEWLVEIEADALVEE
jgi:enamine deaminase RidA (YjgF/YER057c/UK114 family)